MHGPPGAEVEIDGRRCLYFAGTAYLGLQGDPEVVRAACEAAQRYGVGAATTRTGFGNQPPTLDAEAAAARYFGQPAAIYFPSGYSAPEALVACLADPFQTIFVDEQSHYAVHDAARAAGRRTLTFRHRDPADLRARLRAELNADERPVVLSDGVFAASGRVAPVSDYLQVLAKYPGAALCLDDAHGVGVLGEHGRGTFEHFGVPPEHINNPTVKAGGPGAGAGTVPGSGAGLYACGTLSKALGGYGGIIAGSASFVERLRTTSHHYHGTSAPPAPIAAASARALQLLMEDPSPRLRLRHNTAALRAGLLRIGLDIDEQPTPVVALDLGDAELMRRVQRKLMERAIAIAYLRYAGTSEQGALRIAVSALHTPEMIDHLVSRLRESL